MVTCSRAATSGCGGTLLLGKVNNAGRQGRARTPRRQHDAPQLSSHPRHRGLRDRGPAGRGGGLLLWGWAYVHNTVHNQLASQQICFPPQAAFARAKAAIEITPNMIPSVSQYAGQQMVIGQQTEAYADHFIAQHITD